MTLIAPGETKTVGELTGKVQADARAAHCRNNKEGMNFAPELNHLRY